MHCTFTQEQLADAVLFHGHNCPGLTIGVRAAELALQELGPINDSMDLVTVSETDMCGVDGIQYLTGCTLGKGNLILRDYGKMAFTFYNRKSGKGLRAVLRDDARGSFEEELSLLTQKISSGTAKPEDIQRNAELRRELIAHFLAIDLEQMFTVTRLTSSPPRPPRVLASLSCAKCGEKTMETRTRRYGGEVLCIPCFKEVEQKA